MKKHRGTTVTKVTELSHPARLSRISAPGRLQQNQLSYTCMYMYMCVCVYVCVHIYMYVHVDIFI